MIRYVVCFAAFMTPGLSAVAQSGIANTQTGSSSAQSTSAPSASRTFNQTFDQSSAFDGYWIPPQRATDGEEDR